MLPQYPYEEQQKPKLEPVQVCPLVEPHCPSPEAGRTLVGVLVGEDSVEDAVRPLEMSNVVVQELRISVIVVVAVGALVKVCVTVESAPAVPVMETVEVPV